MKRTQGNICKFVSASSPKQISALNFVYETDRQVFDKIQLKQDHTINLVISGTGQLVAGNRTYNLTAGMVFFTFSGVCFKIQNHVDLKYMYITFSGDRSEELFKRFSISSSNCIFTGNEGLTSFWQNAIARANHDNLDLISEGVLLYSFSHLVPFEKSKEQLLADNILEYIDVHFNEFNLSLVSASKDIGYSSKYISRVFKESTGMTFSDYLKHVRIKHSIFLIEQGVTSVKNIALLSGYRDPLYFSNVFKKEVGISASEYIKTK